MALVSREIKYSFVQYIEHKTGKRVRSYFRDPNHFMTRILFWDNTEAAIMEGACMDEHFEITPVKRFCASCGEENHFASEINWKGQCSITVKNFWERVRKVYWHRYLKEKSI